jgi:long-chain acyl-CoA synthetase
MHWLFKKIKIEGNINYDELKIEDLCGNKKLIEEIIRDADEIGRKSDLKGFELPKKILIIKEPFSLENNLLTPTLKLKAKEIKNKYNEEIKNLYN